MEQYAINGGNPLVGEVEIGGAKNAALPILAASLMTDETVLIENMPDVRDTNILLDAMAGIGTHVERIDRHTVKINGSLIHDLTVNGDSVKKIRASYYFLGPSLENIKRLQLYCRAAAISAAVQSTSILKGSRHWARRLRLRMA